MPTTSISRDPRIARALDRSLPLAERRRAYGEWATEHAWHGHPGQPGHAHFGGDRSHTHERGA